jgi:hypothetical protein
MPLKLRLTKGRILSLIPTDIPHVTSVALEGVGLKRYWFGAKEGISYGRAIPYRNRIVVAVEPSSRCAQVIAILGLLMSCSGRIL